MMDMDRSLEGLERAIAEGKFLGWASDYLITWGNSNYSASHEFDYPFGNIGHFSFLPHDHTLTAGLLLGIPLLLLAVGRHMIGYDKEPEKEYGYETYPQYYNDDILNGAYDAIDNYDSHFNIKDAKKGFIRKHIDNIHRIRHETIFNLNMLSGIVTHMIKRMKIFPTVEEEKNSYYSSKESPPHHYDYDQSGTANVQHPYQDPYNRNDIKQHPYEDPNDYNTNSNQQYAYEDPNTYITNENKHYPYEDPNRYTVNDDKHYEDPHYYVRKEPKHPEVSPNHYMQNMGTEYDPYEENSNAQSTGYVYERHNDFPHGLNEQRNQNKDFFSSDQEGSFGGKKSAPVVKRPKTASSFNRSQRKGSNRPTSKLAKTVSKKIQISGNADQS